MQKTGSSGSCNEIIPYVIYEMPFGVRDLFHFTSSKARYFTMRSISHFAKQNISLKTKLNLNKNTKQRLKSANFRTSQPLHFLCHLRSALNEESLLLY